MPLSATISSANWPSTRTRTCTADPDSLYFTAFSTRLPSADTSWRRSPLTADATRHFERGHVDPAQFGERADPLDRPVDDVGHVDEIAERLLTELDAGQLHQIVDRAGHAVGLVDDAPGDALHDLGVDVVLLSASVSASTASAPTGVFNSWLMLATKSVRTASTRRRSLTSSNVTSAPPPGSGDAVTTTATRGGP